ncbi:hypothetical protein CEXT_814831 [Caerostris extrusa]|uniref:Uncharacterized protein n=1 Tax=Caerostris extrusa TaxID=172846 RepID=A0AAV4VLW6_CAEEX|nr:hypothetical protein CEXT_814831 [Caerostris extrusa]
MDSQLHNIDIVLQMKQLLLQGSQGWKDGSGARSYNGARGPNCKLQSGSPGLWLTEDIWDMMDQKIHVFKYPSDLEQQCLSECIAGRSQKSLSKMYTVKHRH